MTLNAIRCLICKMGIMTLIAQVGSVQFSCSVVFNSLWPHGLQHARLPCLSPAPGVYSNSCPLSRWCHPTISSSVYPFSSRLQKTSLRVFSNELALHITWPKYWSLSIIPSNKYSGLIAFRIDWFDLLAVPGTLKSLHQHLSSKTSILWCSAFFMVQHSHPYMTTGKPLLWLYGPFSATWCLFFLIHYLDLS